MNVSSADIRKYSTIAVVMGIQNQPSHSPAFKDKLRQALQSILDKSFIHFVHVDSTIWIIVQRMERIVIWWEVTLVVDIQTFLNTTCLLDTTFIAIDAPIEVWRLGDSRLKKPPGGQLEERVLRGRKQDQWLEDLLIKIVSNLLEVEQFVTNTYTLRVTYRITGAVQTRAIGGIPVLDVLFQSICTKLILQSLPIFGQQLQSLSILDELLDEAVGVVLE